MCIRDSRGASHKQFNLQRPGDHRLQLGQAAVLAQVFQGLQHKQRLHLIDIPVSYTHLSKATNGMLVIAAGRVTVFPRDGQYQMYCVRLTPEGAGDLFVAFEQLKERLLRQGLFAQEHKKPLPRMPGRIALVTSPAGAAVPVSYTHLDVYKRQDRGVRCTHTSIFTLGRRSL